MAAGTEPFVDNYLRNLVNCLRNLPVNFLFALQKRNVSF
jgi:hypothetical protein